MDNVYITNILVEIKKIVSNFDLISFFKAKSITIMMKCELNFFPELRYLHFFNIFLIFSKLCLGDNNLNLMKDAFLMIVALHIGLHIPENDFDWIKIWTVCWKEDNLNS